MIHGESFVLKLSRRLCVGLLVESLTKMGDNGVVIRCRNEGIYNPFLPA